VSGKREADDGRFLLPARQGEGERERERDRERGGEKRIGGGPRRKRMEVEERNDGT